MLVKTIVHFVNSSLSSSICYPVYTEKILSGSQSRLQSEDYPFRRDIHCSIPQSASHCYSLYSHWYIAMHLRSGLK